MAYLQILHLRILSGQQLPRPRGSTAKGDSADPFVVCELSRDNYKLFSRLSKYSVHVWIVAKSEQRRCTMTVSVCV
jgi:hypothetical protein